MRTFEGHTGGVSCVQFDETRIVSGSHDKTIKGIIKFLAIYFFNLLLQFTFSKYFNFQFFKNYSLEYTNEFSVVCDDIGWSLWHRYTFFNFKKCFEIIFFTV